MLQLVKFTLCVRTKNPCRGLENPISAWLLTRDHNALTPSRKSEKQVYLLSRLELEMRYLYFECRRREVVYTFGQANTKYELSYLLEREWVSLQNLIANLQIHGAFQGGFGCLSYSFRSSHIVRLKDCQSCIHKLPQQFPQSTRTHGF